MGDLSLTPAIDLSLDLNFLDWNIFDSGFTFAEDLSIPGLPLSTQDFNISNGTEDVLSAQKSPAPMLPAGINLSQISPILAHRTSFLDFLRSREQYTEHIDTWLSETNIVSFITAYFGSFHAHTPMIHVPTWNISSARSYLILAMVLVGAVYSNDVSHRHTAMDLCDLVNEFAWSGCQIDGMADLEIVQAVYLTILLSTFFPSPQKRKRLDTERLIVSARRLGIFEDNPMRPHPQTGWRDWANSESRLRTAFIIHLFEACRSIFFSQMPIIHIYEIKLPLPCHEDVFEASSEDEWQQRSAKASSLTALHYPVLLAMYISQAPFNTPTNISVMGTFVMLHGILLIMWQQKSAHARDPSLPRLNHQDQTDADMLEMYQQQTINIAFRRWWKLWLSTIADPASSASNGLYRERAVAYWLLGQAMNRDHGFASRHVFRLSDSGTWSLKVPRLLSRLIALMDTGAYDMTNAEKVEQVKSRLVQRLEELDAQMDGDEENGMDSIIINSVMKASSSATMA
ncbi:Fungal specific transcription factor domain-containing protein 30 [Elsinoe fawcettii]|nr:Fungal specific transcription factor domain-containing protein 30 [Elsinoe fawcettii]